MRNLFNIILPYILGTLFGFSACGAFLMPEKESDAYLKGLQDGSNQYHQRCSEINGVMVDEGTLMAVHCRGLGKIDVKEIKKWLHS